MKYGFNFEAQLWDSNKVYESHHAEAFAVKYKTFAGNETPIETEDILHQLSSDAESLVIAQLVPASNKVKMRLILALHLHGVCLSVEPYYILSI